ncbi:hypothetical protein [Burkholderia ubonensis]|uniref:hypothetical protein n=1 Tax=Burkholderia ubonensis TaxID=101571 RepID=UPI00075C5907|nr:hypothetical protein [Burkholderia ubonensis]KVP17307.1 hypothetical protein WJ84_03495 [Burkholderia ubonensis]
MDERKISLRLIQGGAVDSPAPGSYAAVKQLLRRVLKAKLTPDLTVEEACHLRVYEFGEHIPRMEHLLEDVKELRRAGLDARIQLGDVPEGIVLTDPKVFTARFPELAAAVPVMLAHDGVQPYTDGMPRRRQRLTAV